MLHRPARGRAYPMRVVDFTGLYLSQGWSVPAGMLARNAALGRSLPRILPLSPLPEAAERLPVALGGQVLLRLAGPTGRSQARRAMA